MADETLQDSGAEKTEKPSARQIQKWRRQGRVARSRDLVIACQLIFFFFCLYPCGPIVADCVAEIYRYSLTISAAEATGVEWMTDRLRTVFAQLSVLLLFACAIMTCATITGSLIPDGLVWSPSVMRPQAKRINPVTGIRRIFSLRGLVELLKAVSKTVLLALSATAFFMLHFRAIASLGDLPAGGGGTGMFTLLGRAGLLLSAVMVLIALLDTLWQKYRLNKQMMQTRSQSRESQKEEEGPPEARSRRRDIRHRRAMAMRQQMLASLPEADVIITNPAHFAVALRYRAKEQAAPVVIAKGVDFLAELIIRLGRQAQKPVIIQPSLARALYYHVKVGDEIAPALYSALARVIVYLQQLEHYRSQQGDLPPKKPRIVVPPQYRHRNTHGQSNDSSSR